MAEQQRSKSLSRLRVRLALIRFQQLVRQAFDYIGFGPSSNLRLYFLLIAGAFVFVTAILISFVVGAAAFSGLGFSAGLFLAMLLIGYWLVEVGLTST
jgi:hypothetical protein